jgi:hypothetical protein
MPIQAFNQLEIKISFRLEKKYEPYFNSVLVYLGNGEYEVKNTGLRGQNKRHLFLLFIASKENIKHNVTS